MTQLKKFLFIGAVAIGAQYTAQAYYTSHDYDYACATTSILEFAQLLRQTNSIKAEKIAQWLEGEIAIPYYLTKNDIINMSFIASNCSLSTESKIRIFHLKMNHLSTQKIINKAAIIIVGASAFLGILSIDSYTACLDKVLARS